MSVSKLDYDEKGERGEEEAVDKGKGKAVPLPLTIPTYQRY